MMSRSSARPMATAVTEPSWPANRAPTGSLATASQIRTVPSWEPETMMSRSPARPMATVLTGPSWPASGPPTGALVTASQIRSVRSSEPETMMSRSPARPMATVLTGPSWPASGPPTGLPVVASQIRSVRSSEPETMMSRSSARPMATALTGPSWPDSLRCPWPVHAAQLAGHSPPVIAHAAVSAAACIRAALTARRSRRAAGAAASQPCRLRSKAASARLPSAVPRFARRARTALGSAVRRKPGSLTRASSSPQAAACAARCWRAYDPATSQFRSPGSPGGISTLVICRCAVWAWAVSRRAGLSRSGRGGTWPVSRSRRL